MTASCSCASSSSSSPSLCPSLLAAGPPPPPHGAHGGPMAAATTCFSICCSSSCCCRSRCSCCRRSSHWFCSRSCCCLLGPLVPLEVAAFKPFLPWDAGALPFFWRCCGLLRLCLEPASSSSSSSSSSTSSDALLSSSSSSPLLKLPWLRLLPFELELPRRLPAPLARFFPTPALLLGSELSSSLSCASVASSVTSASPSPPFCNCLIFSRA
mmetsp:Transcript_22171/g.57835  ORF Transcript_22171/g.57835 Transcript_22171/m.57835 type:complete len:212 (+) Transcript_22171:199-834(+)